MCSELFRIPIELAGIPIFGIGVLLAVWLIGGGAWVVVLSRHSSRPAEAMSYLPGLAIGAIAIGLLPQLFPDGLPIRGYGVMVLSGSIAGLMLAAYRARQMDLNPEVIYSLAFGMFLCGIVGARLFYVIEYWETRFQFDNWRQTLLEVVKFTEGGLVVYGSLIGATVAFAWFTRRHRLPPLAVADLIAPSLLVGLAFGRIGCLLNGCCYGGESNMPWAISFPHQSMTYAEQASEGRLLGLRLAPNSADDPRAKIAEVEAGSIAERAGAQPGNVIVAINGQTVQNLTETRDALLFNSAGPLPVRLKSSEGAVFELPTDDLPLRSRPVHPTQIYSAVHAALLAWVLWSFYPFRRCDGQVTALMLTVYPISRFLLEMIRVDESAVFGTGLSISQNISLGLLAAVLVLWGYLRLNPQGPTVFQEMPN
ncbi:MAG: prolipoprotein diacylglyceryl transferase [Planctomycetales bacterium]|nr:prolipoprotein diacylglyceryl transferase [Planctomycetales bacterium]